MTEAKLQQIRERATVVAQEREQPWHTSEEEYALITAKQDIPALLAEVERLRAENAAMREIVQKVADYPVYRDEDGQLTILRTLARAILDK